MTEMIGCTVEVHLPAGWGDDWRNPPRVVADLGDALLNHYVSCSATNAGGMLWEVAGEGNYGLDDEDVSEALGALLKARIPFVATSDPHYDMGGETERYDGNDSHHVDHFASSVGGVMLDRATLVHLGTFEAALAYFDRGDARVESFSIDHLPATEPTEEV